MRKVIAFTLLVLGTLQSYAQFSYSIKTGWSWPDIHNETMPGHKVQSAFTLGAVVDYQLNAYLGLQSGLNYKRVGEESSEWSVGGVSQFHVHKYHASFLEIPLLLSAKVNPEVQK